MNPRTTMIFVGVLGFILLLLWFDSGSGTNPNPAPRPSPPKDGTDPPAGRSHSNPGTEEATVDSRQPSPESRVVDPATESQSNVRAIVGSILDSERNGLGSAAVWLDESVPVSGHWVRTDADGRFKNLSSTPGRHQLWAQADGHPRQSMLIDLPEGSNKEPWTAPNFILEPGGVISGSVVRFDGTPLPGITLQLLDDSETYVSGFEGDRLFEFGAHTAHTDKTGRFRFEGVGSQSHTLTPRVVDEPEYGFEPPRYTDVRAGSQYRFELRPRARVTGNLRESGTRRPIERFRFRSVTHETLGGYFSLPCESDTALSLELRARGYETATLELDAIELGGVFDVGDVLVDKLLDTAAVFLDVRSEDRDPVEAYTLSCFSLEEGSWSESVETVTGAFRLDGLIPGTLSVVITAPGYESRRRQFELAANENGFWEARLRTGGAVKLRILGADGRVKRSAKVRVEPEDPEPDPPTWTYTYFSQGRERDITMFSGDMYLYYGEGTIVGLAAGVYQFSILRNEEVAVTRTLEVPESGESELEIKVDW